MTSISTIQVLLYQEIKPTLIDLTKESHENYRIERYETQTNLEHFNTCLRIQKAAFVKRYGVHEAHELEFEE